MNATEEMARSTLEVYREAADDMWRRHSRIHLQHYEPVVFTCAEARPVTGQVTVIIEYEMRDGHAYWLAADGWRRLYP